MTDSSRPPGCGTLPRRPRLLAAVLIAAAAAAWLGGCAPSKKEPGPEPSPAVRPGIEVFLEKHLDLVKGKRVGLVTNPTGTDSRLRSSIDLLAAAPSVDLVALYGPEHGVRGDAQAGEYVPFYTDSGSGLPVFSLYGQSMKPDPGMLKDIDAYMRSFDTKAAGKIPEAGMVRDIDVMMFDVQDVGTRVYTYVATMAYVMQACAESGIEVVVLDRPNPIGGEVMEGPILEYPAFSSFIGLYPVPERHGMTMGELALMFNGAFLERKVKLTVIPMEGWFRDMWFDGTGLPWILPSPNMPTLDTAAVYPGQVLLEGTNVSEGRGTTRPFELFGAPWIDGAALASALNALGLPGVAFREAWFTPTFSKYQGEACGGCQVHVTDRGTFRPFAATLHVIRALRGMYPDEFEFHAEYFDKVAGTSRIREEIEAGTPVGSIVEGLEPGLERFLRLREPYLLY